MPAKIKSALPKTEQHNGLDHLAAELAANAGNAERRRRWIIAVIDCGTETREYPESDEDLQFGPEVTVHARIRRVEAVLRADEPLAEQLLQNAFERRSGTHTLFAHQLVDEDAARRAGIDPHSGERHG